MFRFHKTFDAITLYHAPKSPASQNFLKILRKHNEAAEAADGKKPVQFELEVVEEPGVPTQSQLKTILEYVGSENIGKVIAGASSPLDALMGLKNPAKLSRPLVVDWNNGRIVTDANEKRLREVLDSLPTN